MMTVIVPQGVMENQPMNVTTPDGQVFQIVVPLGSTEGSPVQFQYYPLPPPVAEPQPGLPEAFMAYLKNHPEILQEIRDFQTLHRQRFVGSQPGQEFSLEQTDSYHTFLAIVDKHMSAFLAEAGCSEEEFVATLELLKEGQHPHWQAFDMLLSRADFESFAELLRSNTCICCGGQFNVVLPTLGA